ncbi:hypothetical protein YC2023_039462 [Brassica napus]
MPSSDGDNICAAHLSLSMGIGSWKRSCNRNNIHSHPPTSKSTVRFHSMAKRAFAMLECQYLAENSSPFVHTKRPKRCSDVAAATESTTTTTTTTSLFPKAVIGYPELSAEPNSDWDRSVLCRICVRLPDG